jgi:CMP-N,N'-diacetyllegionaminic acid synthase
MKPIIHAFIPARGGSKGIPYKNIKSYKGLPLIAHAINLAKKSKLIKKIIVSTDCKKIKEIAEKYGAEVPFIRPSNISTDFSPDIKCFQHYLSWAEYAKEEIPDIIVHLRATYPERNIELLNETINTFLKNKDKYTSLRTVIPVYKSPYKMYTISENKKQLVPLFNLYKNIKEPYNHVRQLLPQTYLHNGCIDIINTKTINNGSMTGDMIYPFVMKDTDNYDIDSLDDLDRSESDN